MLEELLKLKKSLKQWETDFYKQHGKKPGKVLLNGKLKMYRQKVMKGTQREIINFSQNIGKCASRVNNSGAQSMAIMTRE